MKKLWCCIVVFACLGLDAIAQQKKKAAPITIKAAPAPIQLQDTGTYPARATGFPRIADPTINLMRARAFGADADLGDLGLPRGTNGFANGHIILKPAGARSTGTSTGSGSVGTGTSPGSIGTSGPAMGVNGKNPYAGPGIYGTGIPFVRDSTKRQ